jgi:hypothetical protein
MHQPPNELNEHLLHDLQQRLLMSMRTSHALASLLQTHALNLEHCAAAVVTLLSPSGTHASESSPTATTASDWRTPGPKDTIDTLTKKLKHALTELSILAAQPLADGLPVLTPMDAKAARTQDESYRQLVLGKLTDKQALRALGQKPTSSVKNLKRKRKT